MEMKDCPSCKQQIQLETSFCPNCGARFEVIWQGYCGNCHAIRAVDRFNRCVTCGGEVIDKHAESRYLGDSPSQAVMQEEVVKPPKQKAKQNGCVRCLSLSVVIGLAFFAAGLLFFSEDARNFLRGLFPGIPLPSMQQTAPAKKAQISTEVSAALGNQPTPTIRPTRTPAPTPTPDIRFPKLSNNALCLMTYKYGMSCLEDSGWIKIPPLDFPGKQNPVHLTTCSGRLLLLSNSGLYMYNGSQWTETEKTRVSYPAWVACGSGGSAWLVDADTASYFDGVSWTDHTYASMPIGKASLTVEGVAVSGQRMWIAASSSVLFYDGQTWTQFEKDKGFNKEYSFTGIGIDSQGTPWVSHKNGLATYNGKTWTYVAPPASSTINTLVVDSRDRVWVGTDAGVSVYEKGGWKRYPIGGQAGGVNSLAVDAQDRVWAATDWGLAVLEKGKWTVYQMSNSDLLMNSITHVAVMGNGPALPPENEKAPGTIEGRLLNNGQPLAKARVEVCMKPLGLFYSGGTPCAGQSTRVTAATDAEGRYSIPNLPPGYYSITFQTPDGKWKIVTEMFTMGGAQKLVEPGQTTFIDDIDISQK